MTTSARTYKKTWALFTMLIMAGCHSANPDFYGFSFLQDEKTAMDNAATCLSMQAMRTTGANSVVLVPFLQQAHPQSTQTIKSLALTDQQLEAALKLAKKQQLHIVIKPQILVDNSWAGAIKMTSPDDEKIWFEHYQEHLAHYARLAKKYNADGFVIGTELQGMQGSKHWLNVIEQVRTEFKGTLTYAANGLESAQQFPYWSSLDTIGITLYPALNTKINKSSIAKNIVRQLKELSHEQAIPVWILEIGMPSAAGWEAHPWDWRKLQRTNPQPDTYAQASMIDIWLKSSSEPWIEGVWLWHWNSSPHAGGNQDIGYTVQNKPAQEVIQSHWQSPAESLIPFVFPRRTVSCS